MKNKMLTALLVTATVMVAACGSQQPVIHQTATPTPQPAGIITEFPLPTANSQLGGITAGPDGNLWFTESNKIGRITTGGSITEFALSPANSSAGEIAAGPDGNLWFTECAYDSKGYCTDGQIGRITPAGKITEFPLPDPESASSDITAGPDGNLWFTECVSFLEPELFLQPCGIYSNGQIGRITPRGQITDEFPLPNPDSQLDTITAGPDGNLWFTECIFNFGGAGTCAFQIGRITPKGQITEFPPPDPESAPSDITAGPDGNLWFIDVSSDNKIGRITPRGQLTEFSLSTFGSPWSITAGPDGNLWIMETLGRIGRITPKGQLTEFLLPNPDSLPGDITAGPDGNLWFTEENPLSGNWKIGLLSLPMEKTTLSPCWA